MKPSLGPPDARNRIHLAKLLKSGGNLLLWGALTNSKTVNNGDAAPSFAAAAFTAQFDA